MKKLRMAIEDLRIETFHIADGERRQGTVFAREPTINGDDSQCREPTNNPLDYACYESGGGGPNCTNVCPTGAFVCDTSVEVCG